MKTNAITILLLTLCLKGYGQLPVQQQVKPLLQRPLTPHQRFINLVNKIDRYGAVSLGSITPKKKETKEGITYYINRGNPPTLPPASNGTTQTHSISSDLVVCKVTPRTITKEFDGALLIGNAININQSVIYPGALFKDDDILVGNFTPQTPARKKGTITIDVLNTNGTVFKEVNNFNNRTDVVNAINALRTEVQHSFANAYIHRHESEFKSSTQINLEFNSNFGLNLAPLIGIPANVAADNSLAFSFDNSLNLSTAAIVQVYYTISLGGEGPKSTIEGNIPSNLLCVTDVQYGRIAFITVGSYVSRTEASLALNQIISLGLDENTDVAHAEQRLSASARFSLQSGFVKVTIIGGSVATAVTVNNLQSFRNYIEQISPTVAGSQAVPIFYSLRYAADNAPARIGAVANITDEECFRADQLKVTLNSITPKSVVDFGDEELFGTISIEPIGKVYSGSTTLWSLTSSSPKQGTVEKNIVSNPATVVFNLNPASSTATTIKVKIDIKDKIMPLPDPEYVGANETDRNRGYAQYSPTSFSLSLGDIRASANGILNKTYYVEEGSAKVSVGMRFQLINSTAVTQ